MSKTEPARAPSQPVAPGDPIAALRAQLTVGDDHVDLRTWAGGIPPAPPAIPQVRIGDRWLNLFYLIPVGLVVLAVAVAVARWVRTIPGVEAFIDAHPGTDFATPMPTGLPAWLRVQHFLNLFLMTFIIRSGLQILADHPRLYWTRHSTPGKEWFRITGPVPNDPLYTAKQDSLTLPKHVGLPGLRHTIGLARWWHLGVDVLWLVNGIVFYVLLFATGEWRRIVPTSSDVFLDAASVQLQYLSLDWPLDDGWTCYNGLQTLAYFATVFVAGPLALLTGLGMSPALSTRLHWISKPFSIQFARSLHFLVLIWFLIFIVAHVTFVFGTGALRNLNHMYPGTNDEGMLGFWIFGASMVVTLIGWVAATPATLHHPRLVQRIAYAIIGPAQKLFEHVDARPGAYTEADVSKYFWHNGKTPHSEEYRALEEERFASYRLHVGGLVENPIHLSLEELRALPHHEQITQHFCIQGWSGVAKWGGVSMQTILELVRPKAEARWVVFYSFADGSDGGRYYDCHDIDQMSYHLTMLALDMNGAPLTFGHGAPVRLRNEVQLGFKQVKWITGIEFVRHYSEIGGGHGGYNEDHEYFGYRQSI